MTLKLEGRRFGRLLAVDKNPIKTCSSISWNCICDCGNKTIVPSTKLVSGHTSSCGCLHYERFTQSCITHGMRQSAEYNIWCGIKARCLNPNNEAFDRYGGRGITMCDRWKDSFENFYADMGPRPGNNYSVERLNNDGNYEPNNCIWATDTDQANNRRTSCFYSHNGVTKTIAQWSRDYNLPQYKLHKRLIVLGWDFDRATTTP